MSQSELPGGIDDKIASQVAHAIAEMEKCNVDPVYFIDRYCHIYDPVSKGWIPFKLWPKQKEVVPTFCTAKQLVALKGRQIGFSWMSLSVALWEGLFRPIGTTLLFSKRDDEAVDLLNHRLRGIYDRLPIWMKGTGLKTSNEHEMQLSNDSRFLAFPTTGGDSYQGTLAIIDEADLVPKLEKMLVAIKPTVDAGGRILLVSRPNKEESTSMFKKIYLGAKAGNSWTPIFMPWFARPDLTREFYEKEKQECFARTGSYDDLYATYPNTDHEALAAAESGKRLPFQWIDKCTKDVWQLDGDDWKSLPASCRPPAIPQLKIWRLPKQGERYVIGNDPAEGNPTSDDSAMVVMDVDNGEEMAILRGRFEVAIFGDLTDQVGKFYNNAPVLVERNNHGAALIMWLREHSKLALLSGDDKKAGWYTSEKSKALMYTKTAECLRGDGDPACGDVTIHSAEVAHQLKSIEAATLKSPDLHPDDCAVAFALATVGRSRILLARPSDDARGPCILTAPMNVFGPQW